MALSDSLMDAALDVRDTRVRLVSVWQQYKSSGVIYYSEACESEVVKFCSEMERLESDMRTLGLELCGIGPSKWFDSSD